MMQIVNVDREAIEELRAFCRGGGFDGNRCTTSPMSL
jgi:hypothetical protein